MGRDYDDKELYALEKELHIDLIPGTEVMTDVGSHHFIKETHSPSHRVLVPQPSADPHDPLNWSPFWKGCAITAASWVTFTQGFGPLALAPMFESYVKAFDCSLTDAIQFTGVAILVLGFSNFFWVPMSTTFGRRPVYIFSQVINVGSAIWRAEAQTYGSFMGACALNGFASGPAETIQPEVTADLFFLHDRGKWNTWYWVVWGGSLMVGPIVSGPMAANTNWRNFWWLYTGMTVLSVVMCVFMFPETKYHRPHRDELASNPASISSSLDSTHQISTSEDTDISKSTEISKSTDTATATVVPLSQNPINLQLDPVLGTGGPSRAQWHLWQPNPNIITSLLISFMTPWRLFLFPIVEFASFVVSWSCSSYLTLNLTQSQAFAAPPYSLSAQSIGFFNFAPLIGAFIGLATAGPLSDWISMRATLKNGGIREPEMRLPAMIPYVLIMILGNVVVAVGYQHGWPWQAIVIIGYTCAGIQVAALPSIASTYAVDSYKPVAGSLFVSITVNKNVWGYGFYRFITPWIIEAGYVPPIMVNMSLITIFCLFGILFYYKGKTFRRWSRNSKVHRM